MIAAKSQHDPAFEVQPHEIIAYLRANGWDELRHVASGAAVVWQRETQRHKQQVLLPIDTSYDDYDDRLHEAVEHLAALEHLSPGALLTVLTTATADIIRLRAVDPSHADGTIGIEAGVRLMEGARDLILAAACAAVGPRRFFQTRKPEQATEYLRKQVRLGQTERGSYVVTVLSKLPPALDTADHGMLFPDPRDPFERRVTGTLARALVTTKHAAQRAVAQGNMVPFDEAVAGGFSVNLGDALAIFGEVTSALRVDFSWSPTRPSPADAPRTVLLSSDLLPAIREAARLFREASPQEDVEIEGLVTKLQRADPSRPGRATIISYHAKQPRVVVVQLDDPEYDLAITAHRDRIPVVCTGELAREGSVLTLRNPRGFALQPISAE